MEIQNYALGRIGTNLRITYMEWKNETELEQPWPRSELNPSREFAAALGGSKRNYFLKSEWNEGVKAD